MYSEWAKRKMIDAETPEDQKAYYDLMEMWLSRGL